MSAVFRNGELIGSMSNSGGKVVSGDVVDDAGKVLQYNDLRPMIWHEGFL